MVFNLELSCPELFICTDTLKVALNLSGQWCVARAHRGRRGSHPQESLKKVWGGSSLAGKQLQKWEDLEPRGNSRCGGPPGFLPQAWGGRDKEPQGFSAKQSSLIGKLQDSERPYCKGGKCFHEDDSRPPQTCTCTYMHHTYMYTYIQIQKE